MSVSSYQNDVSRLQRNIADLRGKIADQNQRLARLTGDINSAVRSMNSASSISSASSYASSIQSKQSDVARVQSTIAGLERELGNKSGDLARAENNLASAKAQEDKKREQEAKKRDADALKRSEEQLKSTRRQTQEIKRQEAIRSHARRQAIIQTNQLPSKIKVLFCGADPKNADRLYLDEEVRQIAAQIRASEHRDSVDLQSIWAVRSLDLLQALNEHKPHIVHFSGHGSSGDEIIFLDNEGNAKFIEKAAIVQMLASTAANLRLVVFNTCFSQNQAQEITQHVEAAIGMSDSIGDDAARNFSAQFYSAIGFGLSVEQAYNQAKAYLMAENSDEAQTPILFVKEDVDANQLILVKP